MYIAHCNKISYGNVPWRSTCIYVYGIYKHVHTSVPLVSKTESESAVSDWSRPASREAWAATISLSG